MKLRTLCGAALIVVSACAGDCGSTPPAPPVAAPAAPAAKPPPPVEEPPSQAELAELTTERRRLTDAKDLDAADKLCAGLLARQHPIAQAEGHKCSANVLIARGQDNGEGVMISGDAQRLAVGGLAPPPRFSGPTIAQALEQLDRAAVLNPTDLSIHQGRLFVAIASGDYERAVAALQRSVQQHPAVPARTWLEYMPSFPISAEAQAIAYLKVLAAKVPHDTAVATELGAWLTAAGKNDEAKALLLETVTKDSNNAMAQWRLGELLERTGDRAGADAAYKKSLLVHGPLAEERTGAYELFKKGTSKKKR